MTTTDAPVSARRRPQFHPLTVAKVEKLTDDAVAVTFDVPDELAEDYRFKPGQALTLRRVDGDRDERRSYSICAPMGDQPRVGVRGPSLLRENAPRPGARGAAVTAVTGPGKGFH